MSNDTLIQLLIMIPLTIWLASLSIKAMQAEDPSQYDPANHIAKFARFLKVFIRRFALVLVIFGFALKQVASEFTPTILAIVALNICISYLFVAIYRDRTLRNVIYLHDKVDQLNAELSLAKKQVATAQPGALSNPLLNPNSHT